jgi:hypothetical protein
MGGVRLQILTKKKKKLKSFFSFLLFKWHHILHCCPYSFSLLYFNHIFLFVLHFNYVIKKEKRTSPKNKKKKELPVCHIPTQKSDGVNEFVFNKKKYNRNGLVVE